MSLVDCVHWLNMDVFHFVTLYDICLRTLQLADSDYDGTYLEISHHQNIINRTT
jgi:hypothetical protein